MPFAVSTQTMKSAPSMRPRAKIAAKEGDLVKASACDQSGSSPSSRRRLMS